MTNARLQAGKRRKEKESFLMASAVAPRQRFRGSHGTIPRCLGFHSLLRWWNILGSRFQLRDCLRVYVVKILMKCSHHFFFFTLLPKENVGKEDKELKKKKQPRDGLQDQVIFNPTISETEHWAMNAISDEPVRERLHALTSHSSQTHTKRPNNYGYHWIFL